MQSLWWKLALTYVVITQAVVLAAMRLLSALLGAQRFCDALRPAVLDLRRKGAVRLSRLRR